MTPVNEADVADETVYSRFSNKLTLISEILETAVVGNAPTGRRPRTSRDRGNPGYHRLAHPTGPADSSLTRHAGAHGTSTRCGGPSLRLAKDLPRLQLPTSGLCTDDSRSGNLPLGSWFSLIRSQPMVASLRQLAPGSTRVGTLQPGRGRLFCNS